MIKKKNVCVVIIPIHKLLSSLDEAISLIQNIRMLSKYDIYLIGPENIIKKFPNKIKKIQIFKKNFADYYFNSIKGYNKLLTSINFYESFNNYEYMLIAQLDSLVLKKNINYWINKKFSYIGAPWFEGFSNPHASGKLIGCGNGGFSLRKINDFIKVLDKIKYVGYPSNFLKNFTQTYLARLYYAIFLSFNRHPFIYKIEDIFWGMLVPFRFNFFKIPPTNIALKFSFEVNPKLLFKINKNILPTGCHAWNKYDRKFWEKILGNKYNMLRIDAKNFLNKKNFKDF